jgi:hypothetical protein
MGNYRESAAPLRYLCIVCWKTASTIEGQCCGVPMVSIENDQETIAELRRRAKRKTQGPQRRRAAFVFGVSALLTIVLHALLLGYRVYDPDPRKDMGWTGRSSAANEILLAVLLTFVGFTIVMAYAVKWLRLFPPLDGAPDPDTADVPSLLKWLAE